MKYCTNCGKEVSFDQDVCINCGTLLNKSKINQTEVIDSGSIGWAFLGFFQPIIGLIIYLIWKDERPKTAKSAGKGALISVLVSVVLLVISIIVYIVFIIIAINQSYIHIII